MEKNNFFCTYTDSFPSILRELNISLLFSTYQAGKVVFISANDKNSIIQFPRNFNHAMSLALCENKLALSTLENVIIFNSSKKLAENYPKKKNIYDLLFYPLAVFFTGNVDIHGLMWNKNNLIALITQFSCLAKLDLDYNFNPFWQPNFISQIDPTDKCHLNGIAFENNDIRYLSALGISDEPQGWRSKLNNGGIIIDYNSKEIVLNGLPIPHSPRIYDKRLFFLLSKTSQLVEGYPQKGVYSEIIKIDGFVRGLTIKGDFAFICKSRFRENYKSLFDSSSNIIKVKPGISVVNLKTGRLEAEFEYHNTINEIFDIISIPNTIRPFIFNIDSREYINALSLPNNSYWISKQKYFFG